MMSGGMTYSKGDIVVVHFPYSNLAISKKRPVLVIGKYGEDYLTCAITSNIEGEGHIIENLVEGKLAFKSKIKFYQIFTFTHSLIRNKIAKIENEEYNLLIQKITKFISL